MVFVDGSACSVFKIILPTFALSSMIRVCETALRPVDGFPSFLREVQKLAVAFFMVV